MKKYETFLYSAGGLIAIFVILLLANFVLGALPARIDLTQGRRFTLSDGTREGPSVVPAGGPRAPSGCKNARREESLRTRPRHPARGQAPSRPGG